MGPRVRIPNMVLSPYKQYHILIKRLAGKTLCGLHTATYWLHIITCLVSHRKQVQRLTCCLFFVENFPSRIGKLKCFLTEELWECTCQLREAACFLQIQTKDQTVYIWKPFFMIHVTCPSFQRLTSIMCVWDGQWGMSVFVLPLLYLITSQSHYFIPALLPLLNSLILSGWINI